MTDAAATLVRLQTLLDQPGFSPRAAARCRGLIERLQTPVRVAVFGLPGAGKAAVVNALAETAVLRPGTPLAPALIRHADSPELTLTLADGRVDTAPAVPPVTLPADALFAELALPLDPLQRMSLLNVVADPHPEDMAAALSWAASRCDIAIWCTRNWTAFEQDIWWNGPDSLKNHALMVASAGTEALERTNAGRYGLEQTLCAVSLDEAGTVVSASSSAMLRRKVAAMIDEAFAEDLDAATFVIEQYARQVPAKPKPQDPEPAPAAPELRLVSDGGVAPAAEAGAVSPEARAVLSRLFLQLRQTAQEIAAGLPEGRLADDDAEALLPRLQDAFADLLDLAEAEHAFTETWPALHDTLRDANELILLLRIEGSAAELVEAAILLSQVRQDVEDTLAA